MRTSEGLAAILLILAVASPGQTQTTTGSILGDITDPSGAVLPGVTVRVTSAATGATRETVTNAVGAYRFAGLQPAEYAVTVALDGFRSATRSDVVLPVLGEIKIDFRMDVGQVTESITVTGDTPLVQPTAHVTQTVIDNVRVQALPLRTRDYMDLALLSPGVVLDQNSVRNGSTDSISFFGMEESHKTIWLDGVDFNDEVTGGGTNISPSTRTRLSLDAVQEFQVMTSVERPSLGSGVIVGADGYILTNAHVVGRQMAGITVTLADNREFEGELVGRDESTDIALLRVKADTLPTIPWGDSNSLRIAEWVLAVGNPFQLNQTVTLGIVSAVGRDNLGVARYEDFIQTDAAINPGNSGGALINAFELCHAFAEIGDVTVQAPM